MSMSEDRMLAARLHGNRDLRVERMPSPGAPRAGEIRVRPVWCGICGTDLHEYAHGPLYTPAESLPQVIGHEFSAEVAEIGDGVTGLRPGDRVAVLPHVFCGSCYYCVRGRQGLCADLRLTGVTWPWGGLAEQAVVPAYQAVRLPDEVSFEQGAILEPLATVVHGVERSGLRPGGSVLITGGGPIGQLAVLACTAAGAGSVLVSEPQPARRGLAERLGVTAALDPSVTDVAAEVLERTYDLGVDCAIECSGSQPGLDACVASVRRAGTVAMIAIHLGPRTVQPEGWVWRDLTLAGVWSFKFYDTPRILAQIAAGTLPVERIVTSKIDIHDLVDAGIERLADPRGDQVKILVSPRDRGRSAPSPRASPSADTGARSARTRRPATPR
jgi:(R,R)-butanediol dehydrogenase / meso-butanediol dehydrogenase / diacetyl reductase